MYTIDYYKRKKEKPEIKEPEYFYDNKRINNILRRRYLHQKDLNDKCWNIKSITIDLEDINHIIQDERLQHLFSLYAIVKRAKIDENINSITILNNNSINRLYIYDIINCSWMINANEELDAIDVLKAAKRLLMLMEKYNNTDDKLEKYNIKNEIEIINYYLNTISNKYNNKEIITKTLKLGKSFSR